MRRIVLALILAGCSDQPTVPSTCMLMCTTIVVLYRDNSYAAGHDAGAPPPPMPPVTIKERRR